MTTPYRLSQVTHVFCSAQSEHEVHLSSITPPVIRILRAAVLPALQKSVIMDIKHCVERKWHQADNIFYIIAFQMPSVLVCA